MPKTNAEHQKDFRDRKAKEGKKELRGAYIPPESHKKERDRLNGEYNDKDNS